MSSDKTISPRAYTAIQNIDLDELKILPEKDLRPVLPYLVRMSLLPLPTEVLTQPIYDKRKETLLVLNRFDHANSVVRHLTIEFHVLEQEVKKEQLLRQKLGSSKKDSVLIENVGELTTEFERSDSSRRIRLVLAEILFIQSQMIEQQSKPVPDFFIKQSDLFDNDVYSEELSYIISIALEELPSLLNVTDFAEILLHVNNGPRILCNVVGNKPSCFTEVVNTIITNADRQDDDSLGNRVRMAALSFLCEMNPDQALSVRAKCVELCRMPALTIKLSLAKDGRDGDMISFLTGILLGFEQTTRTWFTQFIRTSQKRKGDGAGTIQILRDDLLKRLKNIISKSADSQLPEASVRQATSLLRLYCFLRCIAGLKFNDEELTLLMKLVTSKPPPSPVGVRFVSLGLCMLIACPSLLSQSHLEAKGVEWMQWLVREDAYFESTSGVTASFGEMLLLIAIHFHGNQLSAIGELVGATLGMKVPPPRDARHNTNRENSGRLNKIFTQDIFTEQVVASHAVKVPVTINLNANIPGYLPIHCIHQLLKSRVFAKHKVSIKGWIYKQICNVTAPIHPVLPSLIEAYIHSMIIPNSKIQVEHTHKPITEDEIRKIFQNSVFGAHFNSKKKTSKILFGDEQQESTEDIEIKKPTLASQLLLLYYLLSYEDIRLTNTVNNHTNLRKIKSYSTEFLSELPIKYLLLQAEKGQSLYACIFAPLLKLATTHFPHLSLVDDWFQDIYFTSNVQKSLINDASIQDVFQNIESNPNNTIKMLQNLLHKNPTDIWSFADMIIKQIKIVLNENVPRKVQELYKDVWMRLNTVLPRTLWVMTINALQNENAASKDVSLTQENILVDPLQVLRCDTRVYRCAPILQIVLRMLHASLAASKIQLTRHMLDRPLIEKAGQLSNEQEREELRIALVASQESLAVQVLLEACLENEQDCINPGQKWALREVRSLICSHLHQVFIADPSLVKLLHFQGYSRDLISMAIRGIPSMHICLDFIPELLSQPCMEKQIFAIDLISHLSLQYALPKSMSISRLSINTLSTLLGALSSDTMIVLFRNTLPCMVRICQAFPPLVEDVLSLLMQVGRVAKSLSSLGRMTVGPHAILSPMSRLQTQSLQELQSEELCDEIQQTVKEIFENAVLKGNIMSSVETTKGNAKLVESFLKNEDLLKFTSLKLEDETVEADLRAYEPMETDDITEMEAVDSESDTSDVEVTSDEKSLTTIYNLTGMFTDSNELDDDCNNDQIPQHLRDIINELNEEDSSEVSIDIVKKFDILPNELVGID